MKRRQFINYFAAVTIGGAGVYAFDKYTTSANDPHSNTVPNLIGPPPTNELIQSVSGDDFTDIKELRLYESGAAEITLAENHLGDSLALTHEHLSFSSDDNFTEWTAPTFSGPKIVDIRTPIRSNGPYPSNTFKLGLGNKLEGAFFESSTLEFEAPESYIPD